MLHPAKHRLVATIVCTLLSAPAPADIYQCDSADGSVTFTQFSCQNADRSTVITIEHPNSFNDGALTVEERKTLSELNTDMQKRSLQRRKTRAQTRRKMARESAIKAEACARSQQRLDQLRDTKRRGYRLGQAPQLERELAQLRGAIKRTC